MAAKIKIELEMSVEDFRNMVTYLENHEGDIAECIDDLKALTGLYVAIFEKDPEP